MPGELRYSGVLTGSNDRRARLWSAGTGVDFDADGDAGLDGLAALQACVSSPAIAYTGDCAQADFDNDADVDQSDFGIFQRCYSGANPADPNSVQ